MPAEIIGMISGLIVIISAIPYSIRTYQNKIHPNLTSWSLWSIIGLALLLTYKSSGAEESIWPAVFSFTNPCIITFLIIRQHGKLIKPNIIEIACLIFCLLSISLWFKVRESQELSQYALYLAIIADAFAAIPTIILVWLQPKCDRPFAWTMFAIGYGMAIFAITKPTFTNYLLPLYMFFGALFVTLPLILYRWRNKIPLSEWI